MKKIFFKIAYKLGLKRLALRISPSLYGYEAMKRAMLEFQEGFLEGIKERGE